MRCSVVLVALALFAPAEAFVVPSSNLRVSRVTAPVACPKRAEAPEMVIF